MLHIAAAVLAASLAVIHIVIGGLVVLAPTLEAGLPAYAEGAIQSVWHGISAFLLWSAVEFWRGGEVARHFARLWLICAAIVVYVGLRQGGVSGLIVNPQWSLLAPAGALLLLAERRRVGRT